MYAYFPICQKCLPIFLEKNRRNCRCIQHERFPQVIENHEHYVVCRLQNCNLSPVVKIAPPHVSANSPMLPAHCHVHNRMSATRVRLFTFLILKLVKKDL